MNAKTHFEAAAIAQAQHAGTLAIAATRQPLPSYETMEQTLRQWHVQSLNDPEFQWLSPNFEDMADSISKAIFNAADDAPKWADLPGFGNVRCELDALTVRRVGV